MAKRCGEELRRVCPTAYARALEQAGLLDFDDLVGELRAASLLRTEVKSDRASEPQELLATARADYARIVGALYERGYRSVEEWDQVAQQALVAEES